MARKKPVTWAAVYLVKFGEFVKVGITNNPDSRLRTLQTGLPDEVTMPCIAILPERARAVEVERRVHEKLAIHHARGEWFRISIEGAKAALDEVTGHGTRPGVSMSWEEALRLADTRQLGKYLKAEFAKLKAA